MEEQQALAAIAQSELQGRRRRNSLIRHDLFAEPAWDMLLLLYIAHHQRRAVEVDRLCAATSAAATTALRWVGQLLDCDLAVRLPPEPGHGDARIALSPAGVEEMERYLRDTLRRAPLGEDMTSGPGHG